MVGLIKDKLLEAKSATAAIWQHFEVGPNDTRALANLKLMFPSQGTVRLPVGYYEWDFKIAHSCLGKATLRLIGRVWY